jgi:hypothetical protein
MKCLKLAAAALLLSAPAEAAWVAVDLSAAVSGASITAPGARFGGSFVGQTVDGGLVDGAPTGPLDIAPSSFGLTVDVYDPGIPASPPGNGISPDPRGLSALAILLDDDADSLTFTAGEWVEGSVRARFYAADGALIATQTLTASLGYAMFSFTGLGRFRGVLLDDNQNDGLHFLNFGYNALTGAPPQIAEPLPLALFGAGLLGLLALSRRAGA